MSCYAFHVEFEVESTVKFYSGTPRPNLSFGLGNSRIIATHFILLDLMSLTILGEDYTI
jgi:hypothetical protein